MRIGVEREPSDDETATASTPETSQTSTLADEQAAATADGAGVDSSEAEARGHDERVVAPSIQTKNAIIGSQLRIAGNLILGDTERVALPIADVTITIDKAKNSFAPPKCHQQLIDALREPNVILLAGPACGKRTMAGVALRAAGHSPILLVPSDLVTRRLVGGITKACEEYPRAGIVIEAVDAKTVVSFTNFDVHRLTPLLSKGARVVLTASSLQGVPENLDDLVVVECSPPPPAEVVSASDAGEDQKRRAIEALGLLDDRVWPPGDVLALLARARDPERSSQELAHVFDGRATGLALDQWLSTDRSAKHVACLAAAAMLDGSPSVDVDTAADAFVGLLEPDVETPKESTKMFRVADRGWPEGMITIAEQGAGTHFGYHSVEAIQVCAPHTPARIIEYLWRRLGADFRGPLIGWLRETAEHPGARMRKGAAVTAGVLFTIDPVIAERDLIRPWALDDRFSKRLCAAIALGAPVAVGADPAGARALTSTWSASSNLQLKQVAVLAYGSLLGAWDPASAAPSHLWLVGTETPDLRRAADVSIASLMVAGPSAARVRGTVLGMLQAQESIERAPRRVYALLPLMIKHLAGPSYRARESLKALIEHPEEHEAFAALASLLANALVSALGSEQARLALDVLLKGVEVGNVEQQVVLKLLTAAKGASSEEDKERAFDARLMRALSASARARNANSEAARAVLSAFYPADKEQTLGAHR